LYSYIAFPGGKCLDDESGIMYKCRAVSYFSFTAFETAGPDTKTELAEIESTFQKG